MGNADAVSEVPQQEVKVHFVPVAQTMKPKKTVEDPKEILYEEKVKESMRLGEEKFQNLRNIADSAPIDGDTAFRTAQKEFAKNDAVKNFIRGLFHRPTKKE